MNALIKWLENSFAPKMSKVNNNIWVVTLKDSIMQTLPFIFLGSVFCCLASICFTSVLFFNHLIAILF